MRLLRFLFLWNFTISVFRNLPEEDLKMGLSMGHEIAIPAGTDIISAGEVSHKVWYVKEGIACSYVINSDGLERIKWFAVPGDHVATMRCLLLQRPSLSYVRTVTDVSAIEYTRSEIMALMEKSVEFVKWYAALMSDNLLQLEESFEIFGMKPAAVRYTLLECPYNKSIISRIPLGDIASYLGINPATLSRVRKKIAREKRDVICSLAAKVNNSNPYRSCRYACLKRQF